MIECLCYLGDSESTIGRCKCRSNWLSRHKMSGNSKNSLWTHKRMCFLVMLSRIEFPFPCLFSVQYINYRYTLQLLSRGWVHHWTLTTEPSEMDWYCWDIGENWEMRPKEIIAKRGIAHRMVNGKLRWQSRGLLVRVKRFKFFFKSFYPESWLFILSNIKGDRITYLNSFSPLILLELGQPDIRTETRRIIPFWSEI